MKSFLSHRLSTKVSNDLYFFTKHSISRLTQYFMKFPAAFRAWGKRRIGGGICYLFRIIARIPDVQTARRRDFLASPTLVSHTHAGTANADPIRVCISPRAAGRSDS
jgi:hypothetical protein